MATTRGNWKENLSWIYTISLNIRFGKLISYKIHNTEDTHKTLNNLRSKHRHNHFRVLLSNLRV